MDKAYAIFDMDGTLIDSMVIWSNLGREYLTSRGVTENLDTILDEVRTLTMTESAEMFITRFHLPGTPETVAGEMYAIMEGHYRRDIPLKKGVLAHLQELKSRGVRMCVATATEETLVRACLSRLRVLEYFSFVLSCETLHTTKRLPDIYLEAAKRMGAAPGEVAVYEDAIHAAQTAKRAGFYLVGVYDREEDHQWAELSALSDETMNFD